MGKYEVGVDQNSMDNGRGLKSEKSEKRKGKGSGRRKAGEVEYERKYFQNMRDVLGGDGTRHSNCFIDDINIMGEKALKEGLGTSLAIKTRREFYS